MKLVLEIDGKNKIININFLEKKPVKNKSINYENRANEEIKQNFFKIDLLKELNKKE